MREMFGLMAVALVVAALATSPNATASAPAARSRACWGQAADKGLTGAARRRFHQACLAGPLAASTPTRPIAGDTADKAITQPSGQDRDARSRVCAAQADRKSGGDDNARRSTFMACLASAAPAAATGTPSRNPTPTPAKPVLGASPPH